MALAVLVGYVAVTSVQAVITAQMDDETAAAAFWPAAGITYAAMVLSPRRTWPWILTAIWCAEVALDVVQDTAWGPAAGWGVANAVEPLLAAWIVTSLLPVQGRRHPVDAKSLLVFMLGGVLAGPALGGLVASLTAAAAGPTDVLDLWFRWSVGDGVGVLVVAPALLAFADRRESPRGWQPLLLLTTGVVAVVALGPVPFLRQDTVAYFVLPVLVWLAFRGGALGGALGILVVAAVTTFATLSGQGPFATRSGIYSGLANAQIFLATVAFTALLVGTLARDLVRREVAERMLRDQATHDSLTGLANRRSLFEEYGVHVDRRQPQDLVGVLLVDLDGFKDVNDRYGHACGDAVLVEVAHRLQEATRAEDLVVRLGGDEFLVLVTQVSSTEQLDELASRLTDDLSAPMVWNDREIGIGASIGAVSSPLPEDDLDELIRRADQAMYAVKRQRTPAPSGAAPVSG